MHTHLITNDLNKVVNSINDNAVVAFPTGTVYGLAVNALSKQALSALRILKKRPKEKTFTVFLNSFLIDEFFEVTPQEKKIIDRAKNMPLTILLKPKEALRHLALDGRVGLRSIDNPLMEALSEAVSFPLTATSANIAGQEPCLTPTCVAESLPDIELIYGHTELSASEPSTIVVLNGNDLRIVRAGSISQADLNKQI